jgi:hypothetical protein
MLCASVAHTHRGMAKFYAINISSTQPYCKADKLVHSSDSISRESLGGKPYIRCWACAKDLSAEPTICSVCNRGRYCNKRCQYADYEMHKAHCKPGEFYIIDLFRPVRARVPAPELEQPEPQLEPDGQ